MICVIGAMKEEVDAIKEYMTVSQTRSLLNATLYIGTIEDKEVVLLQGGIGKVNTAVFGTLVFQQYPDIKTVINVGSAGGFLEEQSVGDVVISTDVIHHDVDVTGFNYPMGQIPDAPLRFEATPYLVEKTKRILESVGTPAMTGTIVSGDQFICRQDQVDIIRTNFPDAKCAEMEAATVGHLCHIFKKDFIITRSLSDVFGHGDSSIQFDEYLKKASIASAKLCALLIKEL